MLKPEHFSYKCPLKLSDLEKTGDGHFCAKCSKDIHDLTDCSIDEIIELQRRKGSICGFVRAVGVTSLVSLAACSDERASNDASPDVDATQGVEQPHLMGEVCIPEKEVPKPEQAKPETPAKDDSTVSTDNDVADKPAKPEIIEFEEPALLGVICPPDELKPEEGKPLDPHREGSPG